MCFCSFDLNIFSLSIYLTVFEHLSYKFGYGLILLRMGMPHFVGNVIFDIIECQRLKLRT